VRSPASVKNTVIADSLRYKRYNRLLSNSRNWRKRVVRSALHFEVPSVGICTVTRFAEELLEIVMVIAIVD
jgi:hypothetical protein